MESFGIDLSKHLDRGVGISFKFKKLFLAILVKTVKEIVPILRPSVDITIATDWVTNRWLQCCLMYSRSS